MIYLRCPSRRRGDRHAHAVRAADLPPPFSMRYLAAAELLALRVAVHGDTVGRRGNRKTSHLLSENEKRHPRQSGQVREGPGRPLDWPHGARRAHQTRWPGPTALVLVMIVACWAFVAGLAEVSAALAGSAKQVCCVASTRATGQP